MNTIKACPNEKSPTTGNQELVRELNKAVVLNIIWGHAPISRADIARVSGLNRGTVSSLVDELIAEGYVKEIGTGNSAMGRKPIMLQLNEDAAVILGADLGVNYILLVLTDLRAKILIRKRIAIDPKDGEKRVLDKMLNGMAELLARARPAPKGLLGIGIGVPGLVEMEHGVLVFAPNLRWKNVPLKEILQERFKTRVYVDNEANAGALGEKWFGAGQGIRHMVYLSVGVGLGAGIVLNGELYRGSAGYAGELGHFTILPDGPLCGCGNRGCWEVLASEGATLRRASEAIERGDATVLQGVIREQPVNEEGGCLSVDHLIEACERGDELSQNVLRETGRYLGIGIAGLINTFNPEVVIVGNTIGRCGKWVLDEATREMETRGLSQLIKKVKVVPAMLGQDACAMGGVSLVLSGFLSLPKITF
ncbi:MAG: ROK family transcriptional regulator [Bacillota bacterium]